MPGRTHVYAEATNRESELAYTKTKGRNPADSPATTVTKLMMGSSHLCSVDRLEPVVGGREL